MKIRYFVVSDFGNYFVICYVLSLTMLFFTINDTAGFIMLITTFIYAIIITSYYFIKRPSILRELVQFGR